MLGLFSFAQQSWQTRLLERKQYHPD